MAGSNGYLWGALTGFTAMGLHSFKMDPDTPFNVTQEYQALFGQHALLYSARTIIVRWCENERAKPI